MAAHPQLDHVQVAAPQACEAEARAFYGQLLGLKELEKPASLETRGGVWFAIGDHQLHVGVDERFTPARQAHPAIRWADDGELRAVADRLSAAGARVDWDEQIPGVRRFFSSDPWGNRLEFLAMREMLIRDVSTDDWKQIWPFLQQIVVAGETYAYDPDMDEASARELWLGEPPVRTVVAVDGDQTVLGTASMYPNRPGPGSHVASASFMVDPRASGRGVGRALGEDALTWARSSGFRAMQFNAVVETNTRAVALWRSLGFELIGTVPEAFRHPTAGYVGLHVMYRRL